jgi:hypothetical protein
MGALRRGERKEGRRMRGDMIWERDKNGRGMWGEG